MNWYKLAQRIIERDQHRIPYTGLGHEQYKNKWKEENEQIPEEDLPEEYIWCISNGILYKETGKEAHGWSGNDDFDKKLYEAQWKGRFSNKGGKKTLSIVALSGIGAGFRPIPNVILNIIYDEFGSDTDIYRF